MKGYVLLTGLIILLFSQCKSESTNNDEISGNWEIIEATRSKKPTTTINGAVFQFNDDGGMMTDLLGSQASSSYFIEGNTIVQDVPHIKYRIEESTDTTMLLSTRIQKVDFTFMVKKIVDE